MKFDVAKATGKAFRWENWTQWYTYDEQRGALVSEDTTDVKYTIAAHMLVGDRWEVRPEPQQMIPWYRPSLMWDERLNQYETSTQFWKTKAAATNFYTGKIVIEWDEIRMPEHFGKYYQLDSERTRVEKLRKSLS